MDLVIRALAGGRAVAPRRRLVSRFAVICLMASGCFYVDPINQRPSLDIVQRSAEVVYRGDTVRLAAVVHDPEDHFVFLHWRAQLCSSDMTCDQVPFFELSVDQKEDAVFVVPSVREEGAPVEAVRVVLEGEDERGATARPAQLLWIAVADRPPTLELRKDSRYGYVVNTDINLYAKVGDPDDWPAVPELTWEVFTPTNQPTYTLEDFHIEPDPDDTTHAQFGKTFHPQGVGDYEIRVTATDPLGASTTQSIVVSVTSDAPPCLRTLSPVVPPAGSVLPVSEPTLFQVHVVADDLDPFPAVNDPVLGTTSFAWSLKTNSGPREVLASVTGNRIAFDPASYQPGDIVEVRVEIADRSWQFEHITCDQANPTCSVIGDSACLQRQTWRVEVR